MKEKIFRNFSLKILSVLCAVILWTIIVNVNDPNTSYTFSNVTVQLLNTESLTDKDYTYEVVDGGKISVYVSGPKSIVTDLTASDIVATADLSKITAFADYVDIDVQIIKNGQVVTEVEATPRTSALRLNIENRVSQNFNISIENSGELAEGYKIVSQSISPNTVRITGSSSLVSSVSDVKAIVDVSGFSTDINTMVGITIHDAEGNTISSEGLELSKTEVSYYAEVQMSKTVPVRFSLSGIVESGYSVNSTQLSHEFVQLAGSAQDLEGINEIMIPSELLDVTGLTTDKLFKIDLTQLLPENIKVISEKDIEVRVQVTEPYSKRVQMDTSQIRFTGLADTLTAEVSGESSFYVELRGNQSVLNGIQASDIQMSASLLDIAEGTHTIAVTFELPANCAISGNYTIQVIVKAREEETASIEQTPENS